MLYCNATNYQCEHNKNIIVTKVLKPKSGINCSLIPFTLTSTSPLCSVWNLPSVSSNSLVSMLMWIFIGSPVVSILEAVLMVSPNRQYLGILLPTTPETTGPVWIPTLEIERYLDLIHLPHD